MRYIEDAASLGLILFIFYACTLLAVGAGVGQ